MNAFGGPSLGMPQAGGVFVTLDEVIYAQELRAARWSEEAVQSEVEMLRIYKASFAPIAKPVFDPDDVSALGDRYMAAVQNKRAMPSLHQEDK